MTKLIVSFLNFANSPKNGEHIKALTETLVMFFSELFQHASRKVTSQEMLQS